jgi:hypothetical protein
MAMKCSSLREEHRLRVKSIIFWDMMPLNLVKIYPRFGGTYCLHVQVRIMNQARKQAASRVISPRKF